MLFQLRFLIFGAVGDDLIKRLFTMVTVFMVNDRTLTEQLSCNVLIKQYYRSGDI